MYNRYIPQSDGSYRRNSVPDPARQQHMPPHRPKPPEPEPPAPPPPPQNVPRNCPKSCPAQKPKPVPTHTQGVGSFLKQLLPGDFDTGDLLVVLLLLLISSDSCEDRGNALLTLVLYLFL